MLLSLAAQPSGHHVYHINPTRSHAIMFFNMCQYYFCVPKHWQNIDFKKRGRKRFQLWGRWHSWVLKWKGKFNRSYSLEEFLNYSEHFYLQSDILLFASKLALGCDWICTHIALEGRALSKIHTVDAREDWGSWCSVNPAQRKYESKQREV